MRPLKFIAQHRFITLSMELAEKVGLEEAIILGALASEYELWTANNSLTEDGYFYSTVENIEKKTTLSSHRQRNALNHLKELGIVDYKNQGCPPKRYVKIFEDALEKLFNDEEPQVIEQPVQPVATRLRPVVEEQKAEPQPEVTTEEKPKKKVSRKDQLVEFVDKLDFQEKTKKSLFDWIYTFGLPKGLTVQLLQAKLTDLNTACNGNETMMQEAIERAYLNGYFGFFPSNNTATKSVVSKPAEVTRQTTSNQPTSDPERQNWKFY